MICIMLLRLPRSTLFPYTTLFRSGRGEPVHFGHLDVHKHEIIVAGADRVDRFTAIPHHVHLVSPLHERSEEHTSELQSRRDLVCRLLLEKKKLHNKHEPASHAKLD